MDRQTLSNYGWIVICVLVLAVLLALSTPFGEYIRDGIWSATEGLFDVQESALGVLGIEGTKEDEQTEITDAVGSMDSNHSITLNSTLPSDTYTLKYESESGVLTEYADICTLAQGATYDDFIIQNTAPQTATRIGVYSSKGDRVGSIGFAPTFKVNLGNKLYSFGALSDTHVGYGDDNYANALTYLTQTEKVSFITVVGDLTDSCTEWERYQNIVSTYANGTPVYETTGNHDTPWWRDEYNDEDISEYTEKVKSLIETHTGDSLYYSFTKGNDVFIMVGVQSNYGGRMFTQEELQWLYETLETNKDKRCFVFEHVLPDGSSGNANGWTDKEDLTGTEQTVLVSLLEHYPNATLFHAHTHQAFRLQEEADDAIYDNYFGCHSIHIPSVGGTRGSLSSDNGGSQGYVVDVYSNGVVLSGIDFLSSEYLPIAQYYLDTTLSAIEANTYVDNTHTINCEKVNIEWTFGTHINKTTGKVESRDEYASSNLISIESGKSYYFHTSYYSPYKVDICCYDSSGVYNNYITGPWTNSNYTEPIELNSLLPAGTASIRLRMWTGTNYNRKTAPIFITATQGKTDFDELEYTNVLKTVGYTTNKRFGSDGIEKDNTGSSTTGFIPVKPGDCLYLKNITMQVNDSNYGNGLFYYDSNKSKVSGYYLTSDKAVILQKDSNNNITKILVDTYVAGTAYVRLSVSNINETSIITVNEPIV